MELLKPSESPNVNEGCPYIWYFTDLYMVHFIAIFLLVLCLIIYIFICVWTLYNMYRAPRRKLALGIFCLFYVRLRIRLILSYPMYITITGITKAYQAKDARSRATYTQVTSTVLTMDCIHVTTLYIYIYIQIRLPIKIRYIWLIFLDSHNWMPFIVMHWIDHIPDRSLQWHIFTTHISLGLNGMKAKSTVPFMMIYFRYTVPTAGHGWELFLFGLWISNISVDDIFRCSLKC